MSSADVRINHQMRGLALRFVYAKYLPGGVTAFAMSLQEGEKLLAAATLGGDIIIFDLCQFKPALKIIFDDGVSAVACAWRGAVLVVATSAGMVASFKVNAKDEEIDCLQWVPYMSTPGIAIGLCASRYVGVKDAEGFDVWQSVEGKVEYTLHKSFEHPETGPSADLADFVGFLDDDHIVSWKAGTQISLWSIPMGTMRLMGETKSVTAVKNAGRYLIAIFGARLRLYYLEGHGHESMIRAVKLAEDVSLASGMDMTRRGEDILLAFARKGGGFTIVTLPIDSRKPISQLDVALSTPFVYSHLMIALSSGSQYVLVTALTKEGKKVGDGPQVHVWSPSAFLENLGTRTHIENNELPIVHFEPALLRAFRDSLTPRRRIEVHVRGTYLQALRDRGSYEAALSTVLKFSVIGITAVTLVALLVFHLIVDAGGADDLRFKVLRVLSHRCGASGFVLCGALARTFAIVQSVVMVLISSCNFFFKDVLVKKIRGTLVGWCMDIPEYAETGVCLKLAQG